MLLAFVILIIDFLTLGNINLFQSPIVGKIAFGIAVLCVLMFLFGIIKTINNFNRFIAVLLILSAIPVIVLLPLIGIILCLPVFALALYLFFNKKHHLYLDGLLTIVGIYLYFKNFFLLYKQIELSLCLGLIGIKELLITSGIGGLIIFLCFLVSLFLFIGDIFAHSKFAQKKYFNLISFLSLGLIFLILPFLYIPRVSLGEATSGGTGGGVGPLQHFSAWNTQFIMSRDSNSNYVFTAQMPNQDDKPASITDICVDGKLISLTKDNEMLRVDNGIIADSKITVAAKQTAVIKLISSKPFYVISLFEGIFHYVNGFLK